MANLIEKPWECNCDSCRLLHTSKEEAMRCEEMHDRMQRIADLVNSLIDDEFVAAYGHLPRSIQLTPMGKPGSGWKAMADVSRGSGSTRVRNK